MPRVTSGAGIKNENHFLNTIRIGKISSLMNKYIYYYYYYYYILYIIGGKN